MLKETSGLKTSKMSISEFENYFSSGNNPNDLYFNPDEDVLHFIERYENEDLSIIFDELNQPFSEDELRKAIAQLMSI